jgi:hypothetical protein
MLSRQSNDEVWTVSEKCGHTQNRAALEFLETLNTLYEYVLDWSKGSKRRHIDSERGFIEGYIRRDEFEILFGGEMILTDPSRTSEFIGVWGRKAISEFKRTLRERGAEFAVLPVHASDRVVQRYTQYYRKNRTPPSTVSSVRNPNR